MLVVIIILTVMCQTLDSGPYNKHPKLGIVFPILQREKLRQRGFKYVAKCHRANKLQI